MTTSDKHSRRVRFTLPEAGNVPSKAPGNNSSTSSTHVTIKSKAVHGTSRYVNGTLVSGATNKSNASVIVNRNATNASSSSAPTLKTYGSDTNVSRQPSIEKNVLPKIEEPNRGISFKPKKAYHAVSAAVKLQRPRTATSSNISRSQSFSVKKTVRQSSTTSSTKGSNKRYSDSFLYASTSTKKGTPRIKIDNTDHRSDLELPKFEHALDPHLLNLPLSEDANANYLPQLHEDMETNSCLRELDRLALSREKNLIAFWDFVEKWRTTINASKYSNVSVLLRITYLSVIDIDVDHKIKSNI